MPGSKPAAAVIESLFAEKLGQLPTAEALKDPKTRLQEELQSRGLELPRYALDEVGGEPHEQWFVASCEVPELGLRSQGNGSSRRRAEQEAAQRVLDALARAPQEKT